MYAYTNDPDHPDERAIMPLCVAQITDLIAGFVLPHLDPAQFAPALGGWDLVNDASRDFRPAASAAQLSLNKLAWMAYKKKCVASGVGERIELGDF